MKQRERKRRSNRVKGNKARQRAPHTSDSSCKKTGAREDIKEDGKK